MNRPKITLPWESFDWLLEVIGLLALAGLILYPAFQFGNLPEFIPRHFDASGNPDAHGSKAWIWTLPAVGAFLYIGLSFLNRYPYIFNYPVEITAENATRQYRLATRLIRSLKTLVACGFFYISYATIQTALGSQQGLGKFFEPIFLILMGGVIVGFLWKAVRKNSEA